MALALLGIVLSMVVIWRVSDGFETASSYLGRNLSDGVRGATINAIGSSLPELLTTTVALLFYMDRDGFAFGIGTTAGSAIFNSAIIPALVILTVVLTKTAKRVVISKKVVMRDGIALLLCEAVLILLLGKGELTWYDGGILILLYLVYIAVMFLTMRESHNDEGPGEEDGPWSEGWDERCGNKAPSFGARCRGFISLDLSGAIVGDLALTNAKAWALLAAAAAFIASACWVLVESCYWLGESLGIRTYFVAVILAAAATSVPDTILSIKDAKKGNYDDAVSNALGSNIFDICICLGLPLVIFGLLHGPITLDVADGSVAELRVLLIVLTGATFLIFAVGRGMGMVKALGLLGLYGIFVGFIYLRATGNEAAATLGGYMQGLLAVFK